MLDLRRFRQTDVPRLRETAYPHGWPEGKRTRFDNQDDKAAAKWPRKALA